MIFKSARCMLALGFRVSGAGVWEALTLKHFGSKDPKLNQASRRADMVQNGFKPQYFIWWGMVKA